MTDGELLPGPMPIASTAGGELADGAVSHVVRSSLWSFLGHAAASAAAFGVSIVVARALGPGPFGRYSFFLWLIRLLPAVLALGIPAAITKLAAERLGAGDDAGARAATALGLRAHLLLLPLPTIGCGLVVWASDDDSLLAVAVAVAVAAGVIGLDLGGLLPALRRYRQLSQITVLLSVAQVAAAIACAYASAGYVVFLAVQAGVAVIGAAATAFVCRDVLARLHGARASVETRRAFGAYARVMAVVLVIDAIVWGRPELFFLERYRTDVDVGLYSTALRLSSLATVLPLVAAQALVPEFARLRGAGDDASLRSAYSRICRLLAALAAPLALGGAAVAGPLVESVYGSAFVGATAATAVLVLASLLNAAAAAASAAVLTGPRPRLIAEAGVFVAAANIGLAILLLPRHGVMAAALINVGVQLFCVVFGTVYAWWRLRLAYPVVAVARIVAIAGGAAFIGWLVAERLDGWPAVLGGGMTSLGLYLAGVVLTRSVVIAELLHRDAVPPPAHPAVTSP